MHKELFPVLLNELNKFKAERAARNLSKCEVHLGRAHILSQKSAFLHLCVHYVMFIHAFGKRDLKEMRGQVLRFLLVVPGHLFGKVPSGNTGWATVGLTESMDLPKDLVEYLK